MEDTLVEAPKIFCEIDIMVLRTTPNTLETIKISLRSNAKLRFTFYKTTKQVCASLYKRMHSSVQNNWLFCTEEKKCFVQDYTNVIPEK